jgi:hypothetical protein
MKTTSYIILIIFTLSLLSSGCNKKKDITYPGVSGTLTNHPECKSLRSPDLFLDIPDTITCIDYTYDDSTHKVIMKHLNAGFNCCPGIISCSVTSSHDTIFIRESEQYQQCNCECLFDLDIVLAGVYKNKYKVVFIEPYTEGQKQIIFEMDLTHVIAGEECFIRKQYPWGG